ncbi:arsenate-mycothiol transferase ArsC [Sphingobacterium mizutaii]|uniref:arsenate-mycothiol transferase ArsC n=1 Tax=Sphingobacterium mizutaii TaxID=1010 RepID=UPI0028AEC9F1|nr:protein-tyrosine-phosphatase [Sphingobacterium mizutaii]
MNANLTNSINQLNWKGFDNSSRKETLKPLIDFIQHKTDAKEKININFICTHNSRRSHLSQIWAQTAAVYFNIPHVNCYSGGTEETSLFPTVIDTLKPQGFEIFKLSESENPIYAIKYARTDPPIIGFSKKHDHPFNPASGFAAIMTCSQADAGCPFIAGAEKRIPITYEDPKISDGSPEQTAVYASRSLQIAEEMFYVFSQIKAE